MENLTSHRVRIHILGAMPKGNIGTIAAQRALYKLLMSNNIDLSVSVPDRRVFRFLHPESKRMKIYGPLAPSIGIRTTRNHLQWIILTAFNLIIFTSMAPFIQIVGSKSFSKANLINRMKKCDAFIDLNLELIRGIPISLSSALIRQKPRVLLIHKIFWSFRILQNLWFLLIVKSIFKKKLIIGPASFGPFNGLPIVVKRLTKTILSRFIDLILVREPLSAKFLDKLGIKNYQIVTDTALISRSRDFPLTTPKSSKQAIGVAPAMLRYTLTREEIEKYIDAHVRCLDTLSSQGEEIVFLPSSSDDIVICEMIKTRMKNTHHVKVIITEDAGKYESLVRQLKLLIATRMHPSIIAAKNSVPFISIIYDHKQIGFLQQIGLKALSIPIGKISHNKLKLIINEAIQNYAEIKESLKSTVPKLQDAQTTKLLHSILNLARK